MVNNSPGMTSESGGGGRSASESGYISNSLTFDPSIQKVGFLAKVWPGDKITELITRLILDLQGVWISFTNCRSNRRNF